VPELDELLSHMQRIGASDLHAKPGSPPRVRVEGQLRSLEMPSLDADAVQHLARAALQPERWNELEERGEVDAGLSVPGLGRFRVNVHRQRGSVALVVRQVPEGIPPLDELGLPSQLERLVEEERGLILVTGPSGSGKTTTVASLIDRINSRRPCHILTVEDPIEVLHPDRQAMVTQREVGTDTPSYAVALQRALRHDADVIFVGELGDHATADAALTAAEGGHLVITTMRTVGAVETVRRFVELFPASQQGQARQALAATIRGVISQRLLDRADGRGRVAVAEVMIGTAKTADCIIDPVRLADLERTISDGRYHGMQTFDEALQELVVSQVLGVREAVSAASHPEELRIALEQAGVAGI
jgi:twitching motility protein PilT